MKTRFPLGIIPESIWQIDFAGPGHERFHALSHKAQQQILEYLQTKLTPYLNLQRRYSHRYVNNASWSFTCNGYGVLCNLDYRNKVVCILDVEACCTKEPLA